MAKTRERFTDTADNVRPYVERALKDDDLRDNLRNAFEAARSVYNELTGGRGVTTMAVRAASDKEIRENLKTAIEELQEAADRVQGKEEHKTRNTMLLVAGITLGILFNPVTGAQTRKWLGDMITGGGGGEDNFTYGGGDST